MTGLEELAAELIEENKGRAFYVRLALCELHGGAQALCKKLLDMAAALSKEKALEDIGRLECDEDDKEQMRKML
ncbi:MAG: hypothetical protein IKO03_02960 [Lachnospiraceae bacterium]|nr:hypothetical protein [Lachnospiraceae bacterium]MBR3507738.1 hypothetical protein [Lachnospiraceae bacterium]MBR4606666.1 hypothetical protein [Lachnospiraceae bacterium]MBR6152483.1 hypothetical protein [Lachnospiraceae bacterium]